MLIFNVVFALHEKLNKKSKSIHSALWSDGLLKCKLITNTKLNDNVHDAHAPITISLYDDSGTKLERCYDGSFTIPSADNLSLQSQLQSRRYSIIIEAAHNAQAQEWLNQFKPPPPPPPPPPPSTMSTSTSCLSHSSTTSQLKFTHSFQQSKTSTKESSLSSSPLLVPKSTFIKRTMPPEINCLQSFLIMYTDQKLKKAKAWNDGIGKWLENGKWIIYDTNLKYIDSCFLNDMPNVGDELDLDRYLVTVESVTASSATPEAQEKGEELSNPSTSLKPFPSTSEPTHLSKPLQPDISFSTPPLPPAPLKRKKFTVPFLHPPTVSSSSSSSSTTTTSISSATATVTTTPLSRTTKSPLPTIPTTLSAMVFPNPTLMHHSRKPSAARRYRLPDTFTDVRHYRTAYETALVEHVYVQIVEAAHAFFTTKTSGASIQVPFFEHCQLSKPGTAGWKYLLHLPPHTLGSSELKMDDVWAICPVKSFAKGVALARAVSYGALHIELAPFSSFASLMSSPSTDFYALRLLSNCHEFTLLDCLESMHEDTWPLLPLLLHPNSSALAKCDGGVDATSAPLDSVVSIATDFANTYQLNPVQKDILVHVAENVHSKSASITLVHGVFGSGKSHLASVLVLLLQKIVPEMNILISSLTNAAVDRILTCLVDKDFHGFTRIGNTKKIHALIRPYFSATSITPVSSSSFSSSSASYSTVVGATCLATLLSVMQGLTFPIVILDEATQVMEPMALLPFRLGAQHVVVLGDPCQLSPTLAGTCAHTEHLEKTFFHRCQRHVSPFFMHIQYRCPEKVASLASELFYPFSITTCTPARVSEGCEKMTSKTDRSSLVVSGLPSLVFVDVPQSNEVRQGVSYFNPMEGEWIVELSKRLHPVHACAVIALYRAQAVWLHQRFLKDATQGSMGPPATSATSSFMKTSDTRRKPVHRSTSAAARIHAIMKTAAGHEGQDGVRRLHSLGSNGQGPFTTSQDAFHNANEEAEDDGEGSPEDPDKFIMKCATVDAFQGTEKDVVVVSTVRSTTSSDFLGDAKRLNVLLTRAKHHLIVFGKRRLLEHHPIWSAILRQCVCFSFQKLLSFFPTSTTQSPSLPSLNSRPSLHPTATSAFEPFASFCAPPPALPPCSLSAPRLSSSVSSTPTMSSALFINSAENLLIDIGTDEEAPELWCELRDLFFSSTPL